MKAIHSSKAQSDKIEAHKIAVLLLGGLQVQAYVYPRGMRETRLNLSSPHLSRPPSRRGSGPPQQHRERIRCRRTFFSTQSLTKRKH